MGRKLHLAVGLNRLDPNAYGGWDGKLNACVADAKAMAALSEAHGFKTAILTDEKATRQGVLQSLAMLAKSVKSGDTVLFTTSQHGGLVPDKSGDEASGFDVVTCLYDGLMLDDEYFTALQAFPKGVLVVAMADACQVETFTRDVLPGRPKAMPANVANLFAGAFQKRAKARRETTACTIVEIAAT